MGRSKTVILRYMPFMVVGLLMSLFLTMTALPQRLHAAQVGPADQVTLNPGGGIETSGSDGMRFTINADGESSGGPNYSYAGGDAIAYRNTYQYCCSASAPMLNIGGTLYGQAGPAYSSTAWDSVEIISTAGATAVGDRTASTGNSSVVLRYTVTKDTLTYTMIRTVSYVYPNDYVTDSYSFVIPAGNSDVVKFYLGGDTAPGSSDSGYGVMLTSPVRSVISLNTSSHIMTGFREVSGSKVFDGATTQSFYTPYSIVQAGNDIGFVATESNHDAGLMMQWNLGSTAGTQTAKMEIFATKQGTNLNASLAKNSANIDEPVALSLSIVNTELSTVSGLGYSFALPSGLVLGTGSKTNGCGGTMTANSSGSSVVLTGGSVNGGDNCVVTVPVVASAAGTYAISSASFSDLEGALTNNVGASSLTVTNPELGSDLNNDGIDDASQANVYSYTSSVTAKTVALQVSDACSVSSATSASESANAVQDEEYEYINGLMDFTLACGTPGFTATVVQYYYEVPNTELVLRKYDPNTNTYATIEDATITQTTINGKTVTMVSYDVTDGGELDADGTADGTITDPAGLASIPGAGGDVNSSVPLAPNTGVPPVTTINLFTAFAMVVGSVVMMTVRRMM